MIFSIIMATHERTSRSMSRKLSLLHAPFVLGLITGGANDLLVYGRVDTSCNHWRIPRGSSFIKANIKLEGRGKSLSRGPARRSSKSARNMRRRGCSIFSSLSSSQRWRFSFPRAFLLYRLSDFHRHLRLIYQAIFMANAGGRGGTMLKKIVCEVEMKQKRDAAA